MKFEPPYFALMLLLFSGLLLATSNAATHHSTLPQLPSLIRR